jgi:hypothetical protein
VASHDEAVVAVDQPSIIWESVLSNRFTEVTVMSESNKITVNYFCLGALFIFVGSVLLCALGFTVVLPFEATRSWPQVRVDNVIRMLKLRPFSGKRHQFHSTNYTPRRQLILFYRY